MKDGLLFTKFDSFREARQRQDCDRRVKIDTAVRQKICKLSNREREYVYRLSVFDCYKFIERTY